MASPNADKESNSDRPIFPQLPWPWFFFRVFFFCTGGLWGKIRTCPVHGRRHSREMSHLCPFTLALFSSCHSLPPSSQLTITMVWALMKRIWFLSSASIYQSHSERERERERTAHGSSPSVFLTKNPLFLCASSSTWSHILRDVTYANQRWMGVWQGLRGTLLRET